MAIDDVPRSDAHQRRPASPWVIRFAGLAAPGGTVLDLACGEGRHARLFASRGHRVLAIDRDDTGLAGLSGIGGIEVRRADLEQGTWPLADLQFDVIVVTNYLHRPLFAPLLAALRPDGLLLYETFAAGNAAFGKPSRPEFLLQPDELLERLDRVLRVVAFEQGQVGEPSPAVIQRICAVGRTRSWPLPLSTQ